MYKFLLFVLFVLFVFIKYIYNFITSKHPKKSKKSEESKRYNKNDKEIIYYYSPDCNECVNFINQLWNRICTNFSSEFKSISTKEINNKETKTDHNSHSFIILDNNHQYIYKGSNKISDIEYFISSYHQLN